MARVLIVARSAVERAGLESLLGASGGAEIVGAVAPDSERLAGTIERAHPDVILVALDGDDDALPPIGLEIDEPHAALVVLAEDAGAAAAAELIRAGARAVLPRRASAPEIAAAVDAAAAGLVVLHPDALDALAPPPRPAAAPSGQPLTPREVEVLEMLAEGLGNKEIAWRLEISEHTVKFHIASIFTKLNASSRTEAVTAGIRRGLIML